MVFQAKISSIESGPQAAVCGFGGNYEDNESPTFHTKVDRSEYGTTTILSKAVEWLKRDNVTGELSGGRPWEVFQSFWPIIGYIWPFFGSFLMLVENIMRQLIIYVPFSIVRLFPTCCRYQNKSCVLGYEVHILKHNLYLDINKTYGSPCNW